MVVLKWNFRSLRLFYYRWTKCACAILMGTWNMQLFNRSASVVCVSLLFLSRVSSASLHLWHFSKLWTNVSLVMVTKCLKLFSFKNALKTAFIHHTLNVFFFWNFLARHIPFFETLRPVFFFRMSREHSNVTFAKWYKRNILRIHFHQLIWMYSPLGIGTLHRNTHTDKNTYIIPCDLGFFHTGFFDYWSCCGFVRINFPLQFICCRFTQQFVPVVVGSLKVHEWLSYTSKCHLHFLRLSGNSNHGNAHLIHYMTRHQHC